MNTQDIIENFKRFKRSDLDGWGGPLGNVLEALFQDVLPRCNGARLEDMLDRTRVAVYTLFDIPQDSDEDCVLHVLVYDDRPVGLAHKAGDRTSWDTRIIDPELYKELARELALALLDEAFKSVRAEPLESLKSLGNAYLHFLDKKETMFSVQSPKNTCGFPSLIKDHSVFFIDSMGVVHIVTQIGKFTNTKRYSSDRDTHNVFITIKGEDSEREVDSSQLIFELLTASGDLAATRASYPTQPGWTAEGVYEKTLQVSILVQVPYRWNSLTQTVNFETAAEMRRFTDRYFDHDKDTLEHGVFCQDLLDNLGYRGIVKESSY